MVFRRTGNQTAWVAVNFVIVSGLAAWTLRDGYAEGRIILTIFGILLAAWAGFIALNLIRRGSYGEITETGVTFRYVSHDKVVPFDSMEFADIPEGKAGGVIGYKSGGEDKLRYAAFSQRLIGGEAVKALKQAIGEARPRLPEEAPFMKGRE